MASIKDVDDVRAGHDESKPVTILRLDGEPYKALDGTDSTISVVGSESRRMRKWEEAERERMKVGGFNRTDDAERRVARVVAAVTAWHGWDADGADLPCTPDNVRALLSSEGAVHILRQLETGIAGHSLFSSASSVN